jgi:hypothetical protein
MAYSGTKPNQVGYWFFNGGEYMDHTVCKVSCKTNHLGENTWYVTPFHTSEGQITELDEFIAQAGCNAYSGPIPIPD